ncbi:hypothetical protein Tco_1565194, partial [Tanacetum coccineum]
LVVRVGSLTTNPSPPLAFLTISPLKGVLGLCDLPGKGFVGALGCGKGGEEDEDDENDSEDKSDDGDNDDDGNDDDDDANDEITKKVMTRMTMMKRLTMIELSQN